ncbi:hypothetical protein LCGC14_1106900 [marine sediment metagenome]|uniref:Uncharacterized protein n=1 Tax=marine sediment metagenome TaxID=412755 RepID=A0A0F9QE36_9ZZZZ
MMSEIIANEWLEKKEIFNGMGFELIGSKDINEDTIYLVKEKPIGVR